MSFGQSTKEGRGRLRQLVERAQSGDLHAVQLPEIVDFAAASRIVGDAVYVEHTELHRIDASRILRYDLTLPLLLQVRYHTAIGIGYGLERVAMLRYGIDDIRKVDVMRVA